MVLAFALLALGPEATAGELASAIVLLILIAATVLLVLWESYLRSREVELRVSRVATLVEEVAEAESGWKPVDYPHVHTPPSASLVLQWTLRDGHLVNLPWALLVKGDLVMLREGQPAPGLCSALNRDLRLQRGEVLGQQGKTYVPSLKPAKEPQQFLMEETPCIVEIEAVLEQAGRRPVSQLEKQRIFFVSTILELVLLPTVLLLVLVWNCLRRQLLPSLSLLPIIPTDPDLIPQVCCSFVIFSKFEFQALCERAGCCLPASPSPHLPRLVDHHQLGCLGQRPHTLPPGQGGALVLNFLLS